MSGCPINHEKKEAPAASECPINHSGEMDLKNMMDADLYKQKPSPGQTKELSTERMQSSIPKAEEGKMWEYPSPQMFYNAMKRKGWKPDEDDMNLVVAIHNAVNEQAWVEVVKMEQSLYPECSPKLISIQGFASKKSPKAKMWSFLGFQPPFDRHDWEIDRCGRSVRYVIDYYDDKPPPGKVAGLYLDVRPALDSVGLAWDRMRMALAKF